MSYNLVKYLIPTQLQQYDKYLFYNPHGEISGGSAYSSSFSWSFEDPTSGKTYGLDNETFTIRYYAFNIGAIDSLVWNATKPLPVDNVTLPQTLTHNGIHYRGLCVLGTPTNKTSDPDVYKWHWQTYQWNSDINAYYYSSSAKTYMIYFIPVYLMQYKVTFKDGSNGNVLKEEYVDPNGAATPPSAPTGYVITGWDKSYTNVTSDVTTTATVRGVYYSINFNGNNASGGSTASQAFTYGIAQNLNANGYYKTVNVSFQFNGSGQSSQTVAATLAFNGWSWTAGGTVVYSDKSKVSNLVTVDGGEATLYASWGSGSVSLPSPTTAPTGYKFAGWYTASSGGTYVGWSGATYAVSGAMTLYAHWNPISYTLHFDPNGGSGTMSDVTLSYTQSTKLASNTFSRAGYTFAGWATSSTGAKVYNNNATVSNLTTVDGSTYTLYAVWSANTYAVTFVAGTNHSVSPTTKNVVFGTAYGTLPTPTSTVLGEVFTGWYMTATGGTRITDASLVSTAANHSLYAVFATGTYVVQFNSNGGTGVMENESFSFGETKALTPNAYTKIHTQYGYAYDFLGWSKNASATSATYSDSQPVSNLASAANETVTLYAVWRGKPKVTVQSNDTSLGTVSASTGFYSVDENVAVTATVIDSTKASFSGWYVDGTRVSTSAQYVLTVPASDVVYEARFRNTRHYVQIPTFSSSYGSVSVTVAGKEIADISSLILCYEGDTVALKMVPAYNYLAKKWTIESASYTGEECSFIVSADNSETITCLPQFEEREKYGLTVSASGGGAGSATLSVSDSYGNSWASEEAGDSISAIVYVGLKYTATVSLPSDDPNLEFVGWTKDGSTVELTKKSYSFTQTTATDVVLVAEIRSKKHLLNVVQTPNYAPYYGYVEASTGEEIYTSLTNITVVEGQWVTVKATPSVLRNFARWEIDGLDDSIEQEVCFQIASSMPSTIAATAVFESKGRSALSVTKDNGSLGTIEVSYDDVLNTDTGEAGESKIYLTKDSNGEIFGYMYTGVAYNFNATLLENKSAITGNTLTSFGGWYTKDGSDWGKQTGDLSCVLSDTPTVKAVFAYNTLYEGALEAQTGGTAKWSDDTKPDVAATEVAGPKWLSGRTIKLIATPDTGYSFSFWRVTINGVPQATVTKEAYSFTPSGDFTATAVFELKKCPVVLTVDSASEIASDGVTAKVNGKVVDEVALQALLYGTVVTYGAKAKAGYSFNGWYANDALLSSSVNYAAEPLTEGVTIVAKYAATVSLGLATSETATGTVSITTTFDEYGNPIDFPEGGVSASSAVILGEKCGVRVLATSGAFGAWYLASDTSYSEPLEYAGEDSFAVTDNTNLVARLINEDDYTYVALFNGWKDESEKIDDIVLGILSMTKGEVVDEAAFNGGIKNAGYTGATITGAYKYYRFLGVQRSTLTAIDNSGRTFAGWSYQTLTNGAFPSPTSYSTESTTIVSTRFHTIFTAYWGTPKPVRIEVAFCEGSRGRGSLMMSGETVDREATDSGIVDEIMQGETIKIGANVTNGYMFAGWYSDQSGDSASLISVDQSYEFEVTAPQTFYAKFVEDRESIYKWEGSNILKTLRWKSKTYVSNRPFDPTCARIDAADYSVKLEVEMFSSPDQSASSIAKKEIEISSQGARRLKRGRPEKYCALTVEADNEIDAIVIGTNMEGIAL